MDVIRGGRWIISTGDTEMPLSSPSKDQISSSRNPQIRGLVKTQGWTIAWKKIGTGRYIIMKGM